MQLAPVEDRHAVAENEIGIAFDVAVGEVLARRHAWAVVAVTIAAGGEQRILRAGDAEVAEDGAVARHVQRHCLAFSRAGVVDDAQVIDVTSSASTNTVALLNVPSD